MVLLLDNALLDNNPRQQEPGILTFNEPKRQSAFASPRFSNCDHPDAFSYLADSFLTLVVLGNKLREATVAKINLLSLNTA